MVTTVLDILDKGTLYLEKRAIDDARRNMQMLVAHQLGCTRMELYVRFDEVIDERVLEPLRECLKLRGEGIPIQHLLGSVFFYKHEFKVDSRALIPRPETEELAEWIVKHVQLLDGSQILDVGCGSGVLGLSLAAAFPECEVTLLDISDAALELSRENATFLKLPPNRTKFIQSDLLAKLPAESSFDLIVANLPYIPDSEQVSKEVQHDPAQALFGGGDGLDIIKRFLLEAPAFLKETGTLAMEIGHDQSELVESLLDGAGFRSVQTITDLSGVRRFPIAKHG